MEHPFLDLNLGEFCWCLHCERVHKTASWQAKGWECPACGAGAFDVRPWEEIRGLVEGYPERPEEGKYHPQYPGESGQAAGL
jgi:PHP family Zn ribbon phosphoesterase